MTPHILTIDLGTSGPKVALFTTDGAFVAGARAPVRVALGSGGAAEQRPAEWWAAICGAAREVCGSDPSAAAAVVAVSVTAQWSGTVALGHDGKVLRDAIIWMDSRGAGAIRDRVGGRVRVQGYDPRKLRQWIKLTGGAPSRSGKDPIAHILWLQQREPDIARATWKYLEPKDWVNFALTGVAAATYDSIVLHWLTDNRDLDAVDYDASLLALAGIDRAQLPDLVAATSVVGDLQTAPAAALGLPAGIPVIGGTPDVQSAAIGSGAVADFEGHLYVGTSSWITCHVPFKKTDLLHGMATLPSPLPGKYYVADEQESAGACVNWLRDNILYADDELQDRMVPDDALARIDRVAAAVEPGAGGVLFTPWVNGERTPVDDHTLRGGWHNLSLRNTRADMVRAVLEGVAFNTRWLLGTVEKFVGRPFGSLNYVGGGASSDVWCQIMADVLDRPIRQMEQPLHANTRGAALLAAIALKRMTVDDVARTVAIAREFVPDAANRRRYDSLYREFRAIHKQNRKIYARLNAHCEDGNG